jgi:hypothetical protein
MNQEKIMDLVLRGQVTRHHELSPDGLQWRLADTFDEFYPKRPPDRFARPDLEQPDEAYELRLSSDGDKLKAASMQTDKWFTHIDGAQLGPVEEPTIRQWIILGKVTPDTLIWKEGMGEWMAASLVRPQWFSASSGGRTTDRNATDIHGTGFEVRAIVDELRRRVAWIYVVAITITLLITLQVAANVILLVKEFATPADSGSQAIWSVFFLLLNLVVSLIGFIACLRFIQYANIISSLKYAPSSENVLNASQVLSRCWFLAGTYILANIVLIAFLALLMSAFGVRLLYLTGQ